MSLTREEYVAICETCLKRKNSFKAGIVCGLTDAHANFVNTCPDFEKDQLAVDRIERMKKEEATPAFNSQPFSTEKKMLSSGILGGILMVAGGIIWIIVGLAVNRIFFYPFFLIIAGIVVIIKGLAQKANEIQKPDTSNILDDKNDLEVL